MKRSTSALLAVALLATLALPRLVAAQDALADTVSEERQAAVALAAARAEERKHGWEYALRLGTSLAYTHSRKMVGSADGSMFQIGVLLDGKVSFFHPQHEWLTTLDIKETFTKTPNIDKFLKTTDSLDLISTYFYHPVATPWIGPFGRLRLLTSIFPGWDVRDADTNIVRLKADGTRVEVPEPILAQSELSLTSWFEPLTFKETVGAFANPIERRAIKVKLLAGLGAQQVVTRGGYVIADDDATPELELRQLEDYQQVGAEFEIDVSGLLNQIVSWGVVLNIFQPFYTSADRGMELKDLYEVKLDAKLSVKLASWVSLDYVLTVRRLPLILDEWQVQNGLLLTAGFSIL